MDGLGLLRIRVERGMNLAVRDTRTSDPYVVIECASQKVKTRVEKDNCNPVWNEELTILIKDINAPITISVYDHDTFSRDDSMGSAKIDIKRLVECVEMGSQDLPDGTQLGRMEGEQRQLFVEGELHRVEEREGSSGDDSQTWRGGMRRAPHPDRVASPSMIYAQL